MKIYLWTQIVWLALAGCAGRRSSETERATAAQAAESEPAADSDVVRESEPPAESGAAPESELASADEPCKRAGCSGELCVGVDDNVVSACVWYSRFACYRTAECTVQPDGRCGWTPTEELEQCLDESADESEGQRKP